MSRKDLLGNEYVGLTRLADWLYVGSALEAIDAELLERNGIGAVVNLTNEDFGTDADRFKYFRLGCDDGTAIPPSKLRQFIAWMYELHGQRVTTLVHCHAGISRTPAFVIAWEIHRLGLGAKDDLRTTWSVLEDRIRFVRPFIQVHHALKKSVLDYFGFEYEWPT